MVNYKYYGTLKIMRFDVDDFLQAVHDKYEQIAIEDASARSWTRDMASLRRVWDAVMQMPPQGDASLYPNRDGRREPALIEVWIKAGDFWRAAGFKQNDELLCSQHGIPLREWEVTAIVKAQMESPSTNGVMTFGETYSFRRICNPAA